MTTAAHEMKFMPRSRFQELINILEQRGYTCIGPQVREQTIHYDVLHHVDSLPQGMSDDQAPGHYRLKNNGHERYFAWANGPQTLKPLMFSASEPLWQSVGETTGQIKFHEILPDGNPLAVIGVRGCDIAALYIHDKHFLQHGYRDPYYLGRRDGLLLVAVNCTHPAKTCFCVSTGDGPSAHYGYDLLLSELGDGFVIQAHTETGVSIKQQLDLATATAAQLEAVDKAMAQSKQQQRHLPAKDLSSELMENLTHPHWEEIAARCLSCGNCTSVCPTCFCHSVVEEPALDGTHSVHFRQWDSCFSQKHSYIHGLTIRPDTSLRYRQWMTHKLGTWHQQFGRSGCVGCGRCITWCPVAIDFTEEARIICQGQEHD